MPLTSGQWNQISKHPNLAWLKQKNDSGQAIHQDTIRSKVAAAIESKVPNGGSDANILDVTKRIGVPWGNTFKTPMSAISSGQVHADAAAEVRGTDAKMAQALRMIFDRTADGRSAPGTTNVNHIHVGGNGQQNILFDVTTRVVLGVVDGHMDGQMSQKIRNEAARVMQRRNGRTVMVQVNGNVVQ